MLRSLVVASHADRQVVLWCLETPSVKSYCEDDYAGHIARAASYYCSLCLSGIGKSEGESREYRCLRF